MNASAFSDLLGKLPDDMLADAFPNARRFQQAADETADHPKKANVLQKNTKPVTSSIFAPRWTIAAALAACLLFAVGFGALMLHGKQNDLIPQNSHRGNHIRSDHNCKACDGDNAAHRSG